MGRWEIGEKKSGECGGVADCVIYWMGVQRWTGDLEGFQNSREHDALMSREVDRRDDWSCAREAPVPRARPPS